MRLSVSEVENMGLVGQVDADERCGDYKRQSTVTFIEVPFPHTESMHERAHQDCACRERGQYLELVEELVALIEKWDTQQRGSEVW